MASVWSVPAVIIMLSADTSPATQQRAMERGAAAFVSKADTPGTMVAVIRQALHHTPGPLPLESVCGDACCHPSLTPRQSEVLDLLCQGLSNKAIGRRLGISENTVRTHVQALLALLQVSGRSQAVYAARRWRRRGAFIQLEVWDTGIGIAPEQQRRCLMSFTNWATPSATAARAWGWRLPAAWHGALGRR